MSFLTLPKGIPNFTKAVISFWFRIPSETLEAALENYQDVSEEENIPPFNGIIPLVVFGPDDVEAHTLTSDDTKTPYKIERWRRTTPYEVNEDGEITNLYGSFEFLLESVQDNGFYLKTTVELDKKFNKDPCYIGIDVNKSQRLRFSEYETKKPNVLRINLQFPNDNPGEGSGLSYSHEVKGKPLLTAYPGSSIYGIPGGSFEVVPGTFISGGGPSGTDGGVTEIIADTGFNDVEITYTDTTETRLESKPEQCIIKPDLEVTPDHWHHVLLSFNLDEGIEANGRSVDPKTSIYSPAQGKINTECQIWLAFDDENIKGKQLLKGTYRENEDVMEPPGDNDLFTQNAAITADSATAIDYTQGPYLGVGLIHTTVSKGQTQPEYTYEPEIITEDYPMAIPASPKYVENIYRVEMAEFMMWTGETLDLSEEDNRRAFISKEGKPVSPHQKSNPQLDKPSGSIELIGRKPTVMLHRSGNWKKGRNTGSTGIGNDGKPDPEGQFKPTAKIETYRPDPSLHGPQSPEDLKK